jgi:hypothetical protein
MTIFLIAETLVSTEPTRNTVHGQDSEPAQSVYNCHILFSEVPCYSTLIISYISKNGILS